MLTQSLNFSWKEKRNCSLYWFLTNVLSGPHAKTLFHIELLYAKKGSLHLLPIWYRPKYHQARYIYKMNIGTSMIDNYQIWPYGYDSYFKESILLRFLVFSTYQKIKKVSSIFNQNHQILEQSLNFAWKEKKKLTLLIYPWIDISEFTFI